MYTLLSLYTCSDCICQMIKWFAVESGEPLMVKLKHSFDGVTEDVCVCACLKVFVCGLGAFLLEETM